MKHIYQLLRGAGQEGSPSCFIDAWELQDSSDKSWLLDKDTDEIDYTKFGNMRKIDF